jgi:phage-related baseplate assembly protein
MASLNWNDLVELTEEEGQQDVLSLLEDQGLTATAWQPFSIAPIVTFLGAEIMVRGSKVGVLIKESHHPDTATNDALKRVFSGFYNKEHEPAVEAQLLVTLSCLATSGPHSIALGDLVLSNVSGGTYRNVEGNGISYPVTLTAGGTQELLFEAEVAGTAANIADALTEATVALEMVTTLSGVTITTYTLEQSGQDEESDDRIKERAQLRWSERSISKSDDALKQRALDVAPGVVSVAVDSTNPRGPATTDVYIAGLDSTASADEVSAVQIALDLATFGRKATPKTVQVYAAPEVPLGVTGVAHFAGIDTTTASTAVDAALLAFVRATPPGGFDFSPGPSGVVRVNDIETAIKNALTGAGATKATVTLTVPSADVVLSAYDKVVQGTWNITYTVLN